MFALIGMFTRSNCMDSTSTWCKFAGFTSDRFSFLYGVACYTVNHRGLDIRVSVRSTDEGRRLWGDEKQKSFNRIETENTRLFEVGMGSSPTM